MTRLLVSVRDASEALAALAGGAHLLDVKEPANGPLGRASNDVIEQIVRAVASRVPVSAALGELATTIDAALPTARELAFVKWGPSGMSRDQRSVEVPLDRAAARVAAQLPNCRMVTVAYADWRQAQAPRPRELCEYACRRRLGPFLLDTFSKDGSTLLDLLTVAEIAQICRACRDAEIPIALAGSMGSEQIQRLRAVEPDWFTVRGAACADGRREATIDAGRVRHLAALLMASTRAG